jgi:alpha-tubulin suppressor-like RCC1 family protein
LLLVALAGCGAAEPTGGCLAQVTAVYDAASIARLADGTVWASLGGAPFMEVLGPPAKPHLDALDLAASGSTAYGTAIICVIAAGGEVWCVPLPGPLLDSTNLGGGDDFTVVTEGAVRVVTSAAAPRPPLTGARQLAATMNGNAATFCAVTEAGAVMCWGSNDHGLPGRGNVERVPFARPVVADAETPFGDAVEVRLGFDSACARKRDGSVWCWGDNAVGQAGFAFHDTTEVPFPVRVDLPARATRLAASPGRTHCAVLEDDRVACWGWNAEGQAGAEPSPIGAPPTIVLTSAGGPPLTGVTDLAPDRGMQAMCATRTNGGIACWGLPFPHAGAPDEPSPYPVDTDATTARPLASYGERDGALVYVDGEGRLTTGAGLGPRAIQPSCVAR